MNTEIRKRLEEAAEKHCENYDFEPTQRNSTDSGWEYGHTYTQLVKCFLAGAELGYKEAIKVAKEWLKDLCERVGFTGMTINQTADTFETDMNKLWEGEK